MKNNTPDDIIKALKFTPRDITISTSGYGGEIAMGRITAAQYNFWQGRDDFSDMVWDWDYEMPPDTPEDLRFVNEGSWYECDDIAHENGVEMSDLCRIMVTDSETGDVIWESGLGISQLEQHGIEVLWSQNIERADYPDSYLFIGQSIEKGSFWEGKIRITQPFDPALLAFQINEIDGWCLFGGLTYDGEDPEDLGSYDTTGKGSEFSLHYEPAADHAFSDWHEIAVEVPAHEGWYDVDIADTNDFVRAQWQHQHWHDAKGAQIDQVQRWRGVIRLD